MYYPPNFFNLPELEESELTDGTSSWVGPPSGTVSSSPLNVSPAKS